MAKNIQAQVAGGEIKTHKDRVHTVGDLRDDLKLDKSYTASVKGEPQDDDYKLEDYDFVSFAPAVKGGKQ